MVYKIILTQRLLNIFAIDIVIWSFHITKTLFIGKNGFFSKLVRLYTFISIHKQINDFGFVFKQNPTYVCCSEYLDFEQFIMEHYNEIILNNVLKLFIYSQMRLVFNTLFSFGNFILKAPLIRRILIFTRTSWLPGLE